MCSSAGMLAFSSLACNPGMSALHVNERIIPENKKNERDRLDCKMSSPWLRSLSDMDSLDCSDDIQLLSDKLEHLAMDVHEAPATLKYNQFSSHATSSSDSSESSGSYDSNSPTPVAKGDILLARGPPTGHPRYNPNESLASNPFSTVMSVDLINRKRGIEVTADSYRFTEQLMQAPKFHCPGYEFNNNNNYNNSNNNSNNNNNGYVHELCRNGTRVYPGENTRLPYDQSKINGLSSSRLMTGGSVLVIPESDVETESMQGFVTNANDKEPPFVLMSGDSFTPDGFEVLLNSDTVTSLPVLDVEDLDFFAAVNESNSEAQLVAGSEPDEVNECNFFDQIDGFESPLKDWNEDEQISQYRVISNAEPEFSRQYQMQSDLDMNLQFSNQLYESQAGYRLDCSDRNEDRFIMNNLPPLSVCTEFVSRPSCAFTTAPRTFSQAVMSSSWPNDDRILPPSTAGFTPGSNNYGARRGDSVDYGQQLVKENPRDIQGRHNKLDNYPAESPDSGIALSPQGNSYLGWPEMFSPPQMTQEPIVTIHDSSGGEDEFPVSLLTSPSSHNDMKTSVQQQVPRTVGLDQPNVSQCSRGNVTSVVLHTMQRPRAVTLTLPTTVQDDYPTRHHTVGSKPFRPIKCKMTPTDRSCGFGTVIYPAFIKGVVNLDTLRASCTLPSTSTPLAGAGIPSVCTSKDRRQAAGLSVQKIISPDEDGDTLLHIGIAQEKMGFVEALLDRCGRDGITSQVVNFANPQTPLSLAVAQNQTWVVEMLMKHGADVNQPFLFRRAQAGPVYYRPLHSTTARGQDWEPTLCQLLASPAIDINAFNSEGRTPLHIAMEVHGTVPEDARQPAEQALTDAVGAAFRAIENGQQSEQPKIDSRLTIYNLAVHGADLSMCDGLSGRTPLHYAVERKDPEFLEWFLKLALVMHSMPRAGSQTAAGGESACPLTLQEIVNKRTAGNVSALHLAAGQVIAAGSHVTADQVRLVELLLMSGAELSQNGDGDLRRWLKKIPQIAQLMPKSTGSSAPRGATSMRRNSAKGSVDSVVA